MLIFCLFTAVNVVETSVLMNIIPPAKIKISKARADGRNASPYKNRIISLDNIKPTQTISMAAVIRYLKERINVFASDAIPV